METVKYLCEFFFCNFWHYLELLILVSVMVSTTVIKNYIKKD